MTRFRLQLPRQQIELFPGETRIGRSPTCAVTIEDPLISREHGLIRIVGDEVTYEDLASRNGSRINGKLVYYLRPVPLRDGDIIEIGKHALRFFVVAEGSPLSASRVTGAMRSCSRCGLPYSADRGACPHCASEDYIEETPVTEQGTKGAWALEMLREMLDRAIALGRAEDAKRVLFRAKAFLEEQRASGMSLDREQLASFLDQAEKVSSPEQIAELRALADTSGEKE